MMANHAQFVEITETQTKIAVAMMATIKMAMENVKFVMKNAQPVPQVQRNAQLAQN